MRRIELTMGFRALVDDADFAALDVFEWHAFRTHGRVYAARSVRGRKIFMHRQILGLAPGDARQVDHAFGNGLDNRRLIDGRPNLRIATGSQNQCNRGLQKNNSSGFKGVDKLDVGRYRARISFGGRKVHLGIFRTPQKAQQAYLRAATDMHGEFARIG